MLQDGSGAPPRQRPPDWALALVTFGIYLVWSNSFVAMGFLLGAESSPARFDWVTLVPGRFLLVGAPAALWCWFRRRRETIKLLRRHPIRVLIGSALAVPTYGFALLFGQGHGVAAPIASLVTALCPVAVLVLSRVVLGEPFRPRHLVGTALCLSGMGVIASAGSGGSESGVSPASALAITAVAPISWATFTLLSKPVLSHVSPWVWTYTTLAVGGLMVLPVAPSRTLAHFRALDPPGWLWLLFLVVLSTLLGNAIWSWLLRHLDAAVVGLTLFLNPPLTAASKLVLSRLSPSFDFGLGRQDALGGLVVLMGLAVALRSPAGLGRP